MDRYLVSADVLFVDQPAEAQFTGTDARPLAIGYARGLIAGNPDVVQVSISRHDGSVNTWRYLGSFINALYAGGSRQPAGER